MSVFFYFRIDNFVIKGHCVYHTISLPNQMTHLHIFNNRRLRYAAIILDNVCIFI